jgi:hypothetical protein
MSDRLHREGDAPGQVAARCRQRVRVHLPTAQRRGERTEGAAGDGAAHRCALPTSAAHLGRQTPTAHSHSLPEQTHRVLSAAEHGLVSRLLADSIAQTSFILIETDS